MAATLAKKFESYTFINGAYVNSTREIIGFSHKFQMPVRVATWESRIGSNIKLIDTFFDCVMKNDRYFVEKSYASMFYTCVPEGITYAASRFKEDGVFTRQALITFPPEHCFESIQVLVRPARSVSGATYKYDVVVNMRSCNVVVNFANDLYLAYKIANKVLDEAFNVCHGIESGQMHIFIGSLHKFITEEEKEKKKR